MTRLAVISDIHGNKIALQAVLNDLDEQGGADFIVVLGDLAVFGPDPNGVVSLLRRHEPIIYVCGNTDRYLVEEQYPNGSGDSGWQSQVLASFPWTASKLGDDGIQFLATLPPQQLLTLSQNHVVLAVHGSPQSDEENIRPDTPDGELQRMMDSTPADYNLLLCAHTHLPVDRTINGRRVINTGSVGLPFDGDRRASYVLIDLEPGGGYRVDFRRVPYNIEAVVCQLLAIDHPAAMISAYNMRTAQPLSKDLIYTEQMRNGYTGTESMKITQQNQPALTMLDTVHAQP